MRRLNGEATWIGPVRAMALAIGGILAFGALIAVIFAVLTSQQQARKDALQRFTDRGELAAQLLAGTFEQSTTQNIISAQERLSGRAVTAALDGWEGEGDEFIPYSALFDRDGELLAAHPASADVATTESGRVALETATTGTPATSTVISTPDGPVVESYVPFNAAGEQRVLLIGAPTTIFSAFVESALPAAAGSGTGNLYLTDTEGTIVASVGAADETTGVSDAIRDGHRTGPLGDQHMIVRPIPNSQLVLALTAPEDEIYAQLPSRVPSHLALTGFALALIAVFWLALRAVREGRRLAAARDKAEEATRLAEQANMAKSEFLSRMSHELRTPLNAVLGFGQILEMGSLNDAERDEAVDQILKAGRHLLALINEVLDLSRIESGRMTISAEPVGLAELAREAIDLIRPLATDRKVQLDADLRACNQYVIADRQRLKQVLLNLLSNGIKYNRAGGRVHLSCTVTDENVRILVADTGAGIPEKLRAKLFQPFERLGAEEGPEEGTGLGLALSKHLIQLMGGAIGVDTKEGEGSTFWIDLSKTATPIAEPIPLPDQTVLADVDPDRKQHVLLIEDNLSNLKLIENLIARRPHINLLAAMTGSLGLELAREHHPDLILLDRHLPDLQGDEVLQRLRAEPATRDVPVVIVSAEATPSQIKRMLESGAVEYLTKPLDVRNFLDVMDRLLDTKVPVE